MSLAANVVRSSLVAAGVGLLSLFSTPDTASAREVVQFQAEYPAGTIVISQRQRRLYLTLGDGRAIRYPVAVGRMGKAWSGWARPAKSRARK